MIHGNILLKSNYILRNILPIKIEAKNHYKSTFSLEMLGHFSRGVVFSEFVQLNFSDEAPLRVEFKIEDKFSLSYFLAPKLE